jgi:hypothetical protein
MTEAFSGWSRPSSFRVTRYDLARTARRQWAGRLTSCLPRPTFASRPGPPFGNVRRRDNSRRLNRLDLAQGLGNAEVMRPRLHPRGAVVASSGRKQDSEMAAALESKPRPPFSSRRRRARGGCDRAIVKNVGHRRLPAPSDPRLVRRRAARLEQPLITVRAASPGRISPSLDCHISRCPGARVGPTCRMT